MGGGCPSDPTGLTFKCIAGNDQSSTTAVCSNAAGTFGNPSRTFVWNVIKRTYYVLVAPYSSVGYGWYTFGYNYM